MGMTIAEKIIRIAKFKIPYYAGPLSTRHKEQGANTWIVRKQEGRIYPWNFEEMVDFDTFAKSDFRAVKILACEAVPKSKKLLKFVLDDGSGEDRVILSGIHDYYEPEELVGKTLLAITNLPPRKMMGIDSCGMIISATHLVEGREGLNVLILDDKIPAGAKLY